MSLPMGCWENGRRSYEKCLDSGIVICMRMRQGVHPGNRALHWIELPSGRPEGKVANRPAFRSQLCHQLLVQGKWLACSDSFPLRHQWVMTHTLGGCWEDMKTAGLTNRPVSRGCSSFSGSLGEPPPSPNSSAKIFKPDSCYPPKGREAAQELGWEAPGVRASWGDLGAGIGAD